MVMDDAVALHTAHDRACGIVRTARPRQVLCLGALTVRNRGGRGARKIALRTLLREDARGTHGRAGKSETHRKYDDDKRPSRHRRVARARVRHGSEAIIDHANERSSRLRAVKTVR